MYILEPIHIIQYKLLPSTMSKFSQPETLSAELAEFLGVAHGTTMTRIEAHKHIRKYIEDHCLKDNPHSRIINPDAKLAKLIKLKPGDNLTHFNIQKYMSPHFILIPEKLIIESQIQSSLQTQSLSYSQSNLNQEMSRTSNTLNYLAQNKTKLQKTVEKMSPPEEPALQPSNLPVDNINLCFVGGVSTGKSTILNAIFCEELTQCKIKRTTMVPTVYIENENDAPNLDAPSVIFDQIAQKNKEIIEKTESGTKVPDAEYTELQFNVGKLDINILPDSYVNVYDIPGLNDARTKSVYYKYLQRNFFRFNLVVFIVDIHSGLNTSDEADILNFIADHTRRQFDTNQKKIYTLVVVNKADDMQLIPESEDDSLEITGELGEMFDQVQNTVTEAFQRRDIKDHLIGIIPLCAIDSYLYRMTQKHGDRFKLSPEQILKIGINENGKKFSTLKPKTQEAKVREILNDKEFVDTMIKLSGFGHFEKRLHAFLSQNNTGKSIRIENLLFEFRKLPNIGAVIAANPENIENVVIVCRDMFKIFNAILKIDKVQGEALVASTLEEIMEALQKYVVPLVNKASIPDLMSILEYYDRFKYSIFIQYFDDDTKDSTTPLRIESAQSNVAFSLKNLPIMGRLNEKICKKESRWSGYPKFIKDAVFARMTSLLITILIKYELLPYIVELYKVVGIMSKSNFEILVDSILTNVNKFSTFINEKVQTDDSNVIEFVETGTKMGIDMTIFLRFVLLNRISDNRNMSDRVLFQKQMIYLKHGEVPIYSYLQHVNQVRRVSPEWVVKGITKEIMEEPLHQLDLYYLTAKNTRFVDVVFEEL